MSDRIRLFLVDDHEVVVDMLKSELSEHFDLVGVAVTTADAIDGVVRHRPDVVLLDVHMPNGGGRTVLNDVLSQVPTVKFLAFSASDAAEDVVDVIRGGAQGYITKATRTPELIDAIERVHGGDAVFSPLLAGFVLHAFRSTERPVRDEAIDLLTPREMDVLQQIARGYTYKRAALNLGMASKTLETHMTSVLRKLQLSSRHELAVWAASQRLD